jgi:hypothetical protein
MLVVQDKVGNDFQAIIAQVQFTETAIPCCQTRKRTTDIVVQKPPSRSKIANARKREQSLSVQPCWWNVVSIVAAEILYLLLFSWLSK